MADVFITCELSGRELAERLAGTLEREGFSVARNLPPEESGIELEACKVAVVIWTADALASPHVLADADNAREHGKLVNARTADVDPIASPAVSIPSGRSRARMTPRSSRR